MKRTPPLARQEQRQQTRARLVEAALRVFAEQGYDHATVEEISLAAGYSKGAYYFHFDSKEDIFLELLSTWIEDQTRRLNAFEPARRPVAIALLETLESLLRYDDRDPHWQLLLPEIWAQSHRNAKVRETLHAAYAHWIDSPGGRVSRRRTKRDWCRLPCGRTSRRASSSRRTTASRYAPA